MKINFVMVAGLAMVVEFAESQTASAQHVKHSGLGITGIATAGPHPMHLEVNVNLVLEDALNVLIRPHAMVVNLHTHFIIQPATNAIVFQTSSLMLLATVKIVEITQQLVQPHLDWLLVANLRLA